MSMPMMKDGYDSELRQHPFWEELHGVVRYRELIVQLIAKSIKTRYKRSFLGIAWTMINPFLMMIVLTLVFSGLFSFPARSYSLFVLSGLILWNFFSQSTTAAMGDLLWSGGLIERVYFPKVVFAIAAVGTGLVNLFLAFIPFTILFVVLGAKVRLSLLFIPIPIAVLGMFTLGMALILSSAVLYFADVIPMYEIILMAWFYLTPIIYPIEMVPEPVRGLLYLNPILYPLQTFRALWFGGELPNTTYMLFGLATSLGTLFIGWWMFTRRSREYANYV